MTLGPPTTTLVTGAASGIGAAVSDLLAAGGTSLVLLDRDRDSLEATAMRALELGAPTALARTADVADPAAVADVFAEAGALPGGLSGVVSAAGILRPGGLADVSDESWDEHLAVNATGVLHVLRGAGEHVVDGGSVVVVSSNAARVPRTGMIAYAASKAAASAATRCAGLELAARGVRCNVVEPGSTDTPMQAALWPDRAAGRRAALEGDPSTYRVGIPLGRVADPLDVAHTVAFLLSDAARHVTLQQLFVDGGASL